MKKKTIALIIIKKRVYEISKITKIIDWDSAIAEPPSGLVRVEISTVGQAVGTCERPEEIVGAGVDGGVSDDEERRDERSVVWD